MNRQESFRINFDWQQTLYSQIMGIIQDMARFFVVVEIANAEQDMKQSTDFVLSIKSSNAKVAVRIRRANCKYRDFTIRSSVPSGMPTELHKLKTNDVRWYLYGWQNQAGNIDQYMLIDLDIVREKGILNITRPERTNFDGTKFISIGISSLRYYGAIVHDYGLVNAST